MRKQLLAWPSGVMSRPGKVADPRNPSRPVDVLVFRTSDGGWFVSDRSGKTWPVSPDRVEFTQFAA